MKTDLAGEMHCQSVHVDERDGLISYIRNELDDLEDNEKEELLVARFFARNLFTSDFSKFSLLRKISAPKIFHALLSEILNRIRYYLSRR